MTSDARGQRVNVANLSRLVEVPWAWRWRAIFWAFFQWLCQMGRQPWMGLPKVWPEDVKWICLNFIESYFGDMLAIPRKPDLLKYVENSCLRSLRIWAIRATKWFWWPQDLFGRWIAQQVRECQGYNLYSCLSSITSKSWTIFWALELKKAKFWWPVRVFQTR